jgi:hypothetical protein
MNGVERVIVLSTTLEELATPVIRQLVVCNRIQQDILTFAEGRMYIEVESVDRVATPNGLVLMTIQTGFLINRILEDD